MSDLFLAFIDDDTPEDNPADYWKVAIIDDEHSIHEVTKLALANTVFQGKKLKFISAFSSEQGFTLLQENPDCALVLLDVVMEADNSGLLLAERIRNELKQLNLQIILRTGQPGYAPENEIMIEYNINDYKSKNELTQSKLLISVASALRAYTQLMVLEASKKSLERVISASATLTKTRSVEDFSRAVLEQISQLFHLTVPSMFCLSQQQFEAQYQHNLRKDDFTVVAKNLHYAEKYDQKNQDIPQKAILKIVEKTLVDKMHLFDDNFTALYLLSPSQWQAVIFIEAKLSFSQIDEALLKVFCLNMALSLESAKTFSHLNTAVYYDRLTGLYNNRGLIEFSDFIHQQADNTISLYLIDIDFFDDIIESFGFECGENVLLAMSALLKALFNQKVEIAHIHSDVFAVLVADSSWSLRALRSECSKPLIVVEQAMRIGVSIGEASCDLAQQDFDITLLLRRAKMALKVAKKSKRGRAQAFEPQFEQAALNRQNTLAEFRTALAQEALFLVLQPKVSMSSGAVVGYEALLRWLHPSKGIIEPDDFLTIIEQAGLYLDLDMYVFRCALNIVKTHPEITKPISINISAKSLHHSDFIDEFKDIINHEDTDLSRIELEITENALIEGEIAIQHLNDLNNLGFVLCLDDFGAGYSSLACLINLPLDVIKIDRAFISHITDNKNSLALLQGMLKICHDLNKKIVVEGVETQEQIDALKKLDALNSFNIDVVQGYYYFKPMLIEDILKEAL